ncbi:cyclic pyranopterin monophosphate synthase subunit MoaA [Curtobacterium sp. 314Chir4.1]|uniref:GTP 3',8-cyclase MoaA n=1 Tax=Curtobacterium sp. 314Chir4.1 TaxID=1279028 RepID=UPI000BC76273|nr:GTP 3',8-cyclase MoaA [Curtobacterium sp. 314Chir4.1]SOC87927.1 cyclic pyranopterin monophosphate synthase subunit MoaA [Curtobacterium sp. 314Chir4.1]
MAPATLLGSTGASASSDPSGLVDRFGRRAVDLRVSLTERCNLRCTYCMPAAGLPFAPDDQLMTAAEIERLVRIGTARFGVRKVRFTGGEPMLRHDLVDVIARCAALPDAPELSLTTNAIGLAHRAAALYAAGLRRVNVSLDTVDPTVFAEVTRRPFLDKVIAGLSAAHDAGLAIKVNAVLLRGINDALAPDLMRWCLERGYELRFIEQMPLDPDHAWDRTSMVTAAETRAMLSESFGLVPDDAPRDGAPAERFRVLARTADGGVGPELGTIGIIASITESFCADCTRTRLTADGHVRSCLFSDEETSVLGPMRAGASDDEVAELWRRAMWAKPRDHGDDTDDLVHPTRGMSAIGG